MKKLIAIILLLCCCATACAEEQPEILFRGFPWYAPFSEVDPVMRDSNITGSGTTFSTNPANIDTIEYTVARILYSDDCAEDGGVKISYPGIEVAGYTVYATVYYLFAVDEGSIYRDKQNSMLCMGMYVFDDMADISATYDDLAAKLNMMYGAGKIISDAGYIGIKWYDSQGNQLCLFYDMDSDVIRIAYAPGDLVYKLREYNEAYEVEKADKEQQNREENSANYNGL